MPTTRLLTAVSTAAVAIAALAAAGPAQGASDDTSVTINGGTLQYTTPLTARDFPGVTLNGAPQAVTATIDPYVVTDSRGGSAGWNLTVSATRFSDGGGNTLPVGSMRMALPPVPTTNPVENPLALPPTVSATLIPIDGASAQKIASAAAAPLAGAGAWTFTPTTGLTLSLPAAATPGTYTSQITTTLSTGP